MNRNGQPPSFENQWPTGAGFHYESVLSLSIENHKHRPSSLQPPPLLLGCGSEGGLRAPPTWGPSQGPGQGLAPGRPGPRRCGRGGESRGIPGGEGSRARRPGVGSGTGAFSLFRCLKLAPAERCGHVTERRQSAAVLVSAFRARKPLRPWGAAAGTPPGGHGLESEPELRPDYNQHHAVTNCSSFTY